MWQLLTTRHPLPTTHHSLLITHHSPLTAQKNRPKFFGEENVSPHSLSHPFTVILAFRIRVTTGGETDTPKQLRAAILNLFGYALAHKFSVNVPYCGMSSSIHEINFCGFQISIQTHAPTIITSCFGSTARNSRKPSGSRNLARSAN